MASVSAQAQLFAASLPQSAASYLRDDPDFLTLHRDAGDRIPQAAVHAVEHVLHRATGRKLRNLEESVRELAGNGPSPFGRNRKLAHRRGALEKSCHQPRPLDCVGDEEFDDMHGCQVLVAWCSQQNFEVCGQHAGEGKRHAGHDPQLHGPLGQIRLPG
jgi:hypothetical protein